MKKICLLTYNLGSGGAEHVISQWSQLLCEHYDVYMTVFDSEQVVYPYGGTFVDLDVKSNNKSFLSKVIVVIKRIFSLRKFVKKNKIDLVISFCNACNLVNVLCPVKVKKICSIRSAGDVNANGFVKNVIKDRNSTLIVQTNALKQTIVEEYGDSLDKKIIVCGNPFDAERIKALSKEPLEKKFIEFTEGKKVLLSVASFKKSKNHANLLKSFELCCEKRDDLCLVLVGADNGLRKNIVKMAQGSKYKDKILFYGETKNPYNIMANSSLFLLPSLSEGVPNVVAEAMICGMPIVSSNCPTGPEELLSDGIEKIKMNSDGYFEAAYGILVEPFQQETNYDYAFITEDNYKFSKAILYALESSDSLELLANKALTGAKKFDLNLYKEDLIRLIEERFK